MTTEDRALLELQIGDLRRSIRNTETSPRRYMGSLACTVLYGLFLLFAVGDRKETAFVLMTFLSAITVAFIAIGENSKLLSEKVNQLVELDELSDKLKREKES